MANHLFDENGNQIGTIKTEAEASSEAMGILVFLVAPFSPILWIAWQAGAYLSTFNTGTRCPA